jgi:lysozyme
MPTARWALVGALSACAGPAVDPSLGEDELEATVCGSGATVKGIDVSYYQGAIDWPAVRADGVEYAFVRATDGLGYRDSRFEANWAGAGAQGILRGAYQFFRPTQDPIAQADLLLSMIASSPGELPPVIDVEDSGGLSPSVVAARVRTWIERVRPVIGREPIIYTGFYFWRDDVGAADMTGSPLWHAQYSSAQCPTIAAPWSDWAFWQYTATGRVAGIAGDVDVNRWNGTAEDLAVFAGGPRPCGIIGPQGGEIDDGDPCFQGGGPPEFLRRVTGAGIDGDLTWTYATASAREVSYGHWDLVLAEAGRYRVEVSTPSPYAASSLARYVVTAAGVRHELALDQSAAGGWQLLGELEFAAGGEQWVHLGDNTGDPSADRVQLVFDALRLTRIPSEGGDDGGDGGGGGGDIDGGGGDADTGCRAGSAGSSAGSSPGALGVALGLALAAARRRRRSRTAIPAPAGPGAERA